MSTQFGRRTSRGGAVSAWRQRRSWQTNSHRKTPEDGQPGCTRAARSSFLCAGPGCSFVPPVSCSPLGQQHDTTRFRQMLCPDASCEVCNHATAEISSLLFSGDLEDATPSVSPLASTVSGTESSFPPSPGYSALPAGTPIPDPLFEPSSSPPLTLSTNPMTPFPNSPSPLPLAHSLPPEPFRPLESQFPAEHSQPEPPGTPSRGTPRAEDPLLQPEAPLTLNSVFLDPSLFQHADPFPQLSLTMNPTDSFAYHHTAAVLSTSPSPGSNFTVAHADQRKPGLHLNASESAAGQHDSVAALTLWSSKGKPSELQFHPQPSHPQAWEDHLQKIHIYLFWGFPSLHSESLPSAIHVRGDYSSIFIFNRIPNASACQEYPILFHPLPPSLPEVQPRPSPEILPQAHLPSPLPALPSGPIPELRKHGGHFHRPQNESGTIASSTKQHLAWHVLRKQQERMWGLPSVVQRSQEDFRSSALNSADELRRPPQAQVSVSILPGDYALSSELRKTLEHHLRKRLIQHRWGLPCRIRKSVSLLRPRSHCSETSKSSSNYGLSWICAYKGKNSQNSNVGFSQQGSFSEWGENELKGEGNSPGDASTSSESSSDNDLACDSKEDLGRHRESLLGDNAMFSGLSQRQRQLENMLKMHSSNTLEETNAGQLPAPVPSAWHATKRVPTPPANSHADAKQGSVPPSLGGGCCLNTCQELCFLECCTQQRLDSHMKNFCVRMSSGHPAKVLKSIEIFQDSSSHSLLNSNLPSCMNLDSEVGSTSGGFMPLGGSKASLRGDNMGTAHSASVLQHPVPTASHVGQEGRGSVSQSPSAMHQGLPGHSQTMRDARQTLQPVTQSITGTESPKQTLPIKKPSPKLPATRAEARHEPKGQRGISTDRIQRLKGKETHQESQCVSMLMVRQIFRATELDAPHSGTSDILTTSEPGISQKIPVNDIKGEATLSTESPPATRPALRDPKSSDSKEQVLRQLRSELDNQERSQAQGQCSDMAAASDGRAYKASQTQAQGVPRVHTGARQVLHVQGEDRGVATQQRQAPWLPEYVIRCGQGKNFPPAKRTVSHPVPESEALAGGDSGFRTSQPGWKTVPTQDMPLDKKLGSKSSQTLSQEGLSPPEKPLRLNMKRFFQWLHPVLKWEQQANSHGKGRPVVSSAGSRGPERSRAAFSGPTEAQKVTTGPGKCLQEKLGRRRATDIPCPQEPLPAPGKFGKPQTKAQVPAQSGPIQRHPSSSRAPCCKVTKSCQQAAGFAGQSPINGRQTRARDRQPHQKVVAFQEQFSSQKHLQSWPSREAVPHPSLDQSCESIRQMSNQDRQAQKAGAVKEQLMYQKHPRSRPQRGAVPQPSHTYGRQAGQGPKAAPATAEGTFFRDGSLLLSQKSILDKLQGKHLPTPN
ncbi:spermatogenesis-associated protein 31D1-like [Hipposideros larvatus]